ncbi:hypothetical protein CHUAL_002077 [Chamberlinius hualienensis]
MDAVTSAIKCPDRCHLHQNRYRWLFEQFKAVVLIPIGNSTDAIWINSDYNVGYVNHRNLATKKLEIGLGLRKDDRRQENGHLSPSEFQPRPQLNSNKESFVSKLIRRLKCWGKAQPPPKSRILWVGHHPPTHLHDQLNRRDSSAVPSVQIQPTKLPKYPNNQIITSKYTLWNFIPKNLFEQFRRLANFYFLIIAVIQCALPNSPVSPMTSVLPLIFVVGVTALKQGYEDWLRHKADNLVNNREFVVLMDGVEVTVKSKDLKVGDVVKVKQEEEFPCDLVMLASADCSGECHVTTANLDGETTLKVQYCVPETKCYCSVEALKNVRAEIECDLPNADLYKFKGVLKLSSNNPGSSDYTKCPLGPENVLLRGASLKNVSHVYGCAIYTGQQTKLALNSKMTPNKFSTVERSMNIYLIIFLLLLVVEVCLCAALLYGYRTNPNSPVPWYIENGEKEASGGWDVVESVLSYIVLLNYTIPISMYVTLEMQKFLGSLFFEWDAELFDPKTEQFAKCNCSDLNEELGQVQVVFTDKTGTLTENDMQFRQCSIRGQCYADIEGKLCSVSNSNCVGDVSTVAVTSMNDVELQFFTALALCHTAQVGHKPTSARVNLAFSMEENIDNCIEMEELETESGVLEYQATSPDEQALLEACKRYGVVYHGAQDDKCHLTINGRCSSYQRLQVLEFDSDRKMMSVIVQDPSGQIYLYSKGAETSIISRSEDGPREETLKHVTEYAMLGLRTLVIGVRTLSEYDYRTFEAEIREARASIEGREEKIAEVFETIEKNLTVLGATAVEDRLQDGVQETLEALREAEIKVWMLTGDKEETAVNIAFSCNYFTQEMTILYLTKQRDQDSTIRTLHEVKKKVDQVPLESEEQLALVVDGGTLAFIFSSMFIMMFQEICSRCKVAICCRMSPIQKAMVVRMIKKSPWRPITAAIGDGANDVAMIQEAHVGLGVMGKEGRQAVRCSDFAFARFRHLQRVLLIHGHYYYVRVAMLVQYSFYKNLAFITPQLYFVFFAYFSAQPLYDGWFLTVYNLLYTSLPILIFGLFEQNISQTRLMENPKLYLLNAKNALLSHLQFFKWCIFGVWHSIVLFFGAYLLFQNEVLSPWGWTYDYWCMGTLVYHACVFVINLKLCLESRFFTGIFMFSIVVSLLGFIGLTILYSATTIWSFLADGTGMFWVYLQLISSGSFWFCTTLIIVACLLPDLLFGILDFDNEYMKAVYKKVFPRYVGKGGVNRAPNDNNNVRELSPIYRVSSNRYSKKNSNNSSSQNQSLKNDNYVVYEIIGRSNLKPRQCFNGLLELVGSGSAGSVLASRLSEIAEWKILLLEAGGDESLLSVAPAAVHFLQLSDYDWKYRTTPQNDSCFAFKNRQNLWPRGKCLGGSSSINYMIYARGNRRDFDRWEYEGNHGWSWQDVLPYFKKFENYTNLSMRDDDLLFGHDGPLNVGFTEFETPLLEAFLEAVKWHGYSINDYNGQFQTGAYKVATTQRNGARLSVANAYIKSMGQRPNLTILKQATVVKILFNHYRRAYGVSFDHFGKRKFAYATKEIIVSAGTINSPQLLMLSGIGPKNHLEKHGIPVVVDLPGVGENLQDHVTNGGPMFIIQSPISITFIRTISELLPWILYGEGPLTSLGSVEALGFIKTSLSQINDDWPDIEYHFTAGSVVSDHGIHLRNVFGFTDQVWDNYFASFINSDTFTIYTSLLHPKSRGTIRLQSDNPYVHPLIDPRYYTHPEDIQVMTEGTKLALSIGNSEPFKKFGAFVNPLPFPPCNQLKFQNDEYISCVARSYSTTFYHPVGTCKMGVDSMAVVDSQLRVYGVRGLRVVDASIMPYITSGNTNAPTVMIAEKASDDIKKYWKEFQHI